MEHFSQNVAVYVSRRLRFLAIFVSVIVGCGEHDRPPQEAFVLENETE